MSQYKGSELELFQFAINWKKYYGKKIKKYIKGDVLEVGAGIGETTRHLIKNQNSWVCLEPDEHLCGIINHKKEVGRLPSHVHVISGTLSDLPSDQYFDTIIYIDVLEHIENDSVELKNAFSRLKKGGHLVILVPAWQFLYNEFDQAIGHYRRYNKSLLRNAIPPNAQTIFLKYFDSLGFFASVANKLFLNQSYPNRKQINIWDKFMVPLSRISDKVLLHSFGKSLVGVWRKDK